MRVGDVYRYDASEAEMHDGELVRITRLADADGVVHADLLSDENVALEVHIDFLVEVD